jgi:hypothetical protein
MSDQAICTLLANDLCPECLGDLDTGWECNKCGYDAMPLMQQIGKDKIEAEKAKPKPKPVTETAEAEWGV